MKSLRLLAVFVVLLLLFPLNEVHCGQDYVEYQVQINGDSSASWTIVLVSDINTTIDNWAGFQQRIFTLVEAAKNVTGREMAIAPETIQMETVIAWETQSKTTEFRFKWLNFSMSEDDRLVFGDVFKIQAFFTGLYGDGTLQLVYATGYTVLGVSPSPDRQSDDRRTLEWFRSQDFLSGKPGVTLASDSSSSVYGDWMQPSVWFWILTVAALASLSGFYLVRRRKSKTSSIGSSAVEQFLLESDEEKVIKFIKSSGGSIYQSGISEQFGFSKAKTSQLFASLERKGIVARYKRGRDKIVNLIKQTAGDKS